MANSRASLKNPPITEAVIDFRIDKDEPIELAQLREVAKQLESHYETIGTIYEAKANLGLAEAKMTARVDSKEVGIRAHSNDKLFVAQLQLNGFSLSRLAPYESWENLVEEARHVWGLYVSQVNPNAIVRIATRFINNLQLPMKPGDEFEKFLRKPPDVPESLPQSVFGFLSRVMLEDPRTGIKATITQALEPGTYAGPIPVILDVDVYDQRNFAVEDEVLFSRLEELRDFKNLAFYESLTGTTIELYQ